MLTDYILLTEPPSRLNLTGFQIGLGWFSNVKLRSPEQKKGEVKAYSPELLILLELSRFGRYEVDTTERKEGESI